MSSNLIRWCATAAAAVMVLCLGCGGEKPSEEEAPLASAHDAAQVRWNDGLEAAMSRAERQGTPVLVNFYADWCVWCKRLESTTFADRQVASLLAAEVIPVRLDVDGDGRDLSREMGVSGLPTTVVLSPDGREVGRINGYQPPAAFREQLSSILAAGS